MSGGVSVDAEALTGFVAERLAAVADPDKARPMAAYMKTDMPFYGVQKPGRVKIVCQIKQRFRIKNRQDYEGTVLTLWKRPHREEKYLAIQIAMDCREYVEPHSMALYERLVREGAWWDFVDDAAIRLVGRVLRQHREAISPLMDAWIEDDDLWIRRSALISQISHREATDHKRLFAYCRRRAPESEFFIRKAIGWALRDYSYAAPERVLSFLTKNRTRLSGLSFREGAKALRRRGFDI